MFTAKGSRRPQHSPFPTAMLTIFVRCPCDIHSLRSERWREADPVTPSRDSPVLWLFSLEGTRSCHNRFSLMGAARLPQAAPYIQRIQPGYLPEVGLTFVIGSHRLCIELLFYSCKGCYLLHNSCHSRFQSLRKQKGSLIAVNAGFPTQANRLPKFTMSVCPSWAGCTKSADRLLHQSCTQAILNAFNANSPNT